MNNDINLTEEETERYKTLINPDEKQSRTYFWDERYQEEILGYLLHERSFLVQSIELIKPYYFTNEAHQIACTILLEYFEKYKQIPPKFSLINEVKQRKQGDKKLLRHLGHIESVYSQFVAGRESRDAALDKITAFAKEQALKSGVSIVLDVLESHKPDKWEKIRDVLKKALSVDRSFDFGLDYFCTAEERYKEMEEEEAAKEVFITGFPFIDTRLASGGLCRGEIASFVGKPGAGKCFAKGTKVLMYDGSTKAVENINPGEQLMGRDSTPRNVLSLASGREMMYKVTPVKGSPYIVNESHLLCLKNSNKIGTLKPSGKRLKNPLYGNHFSKVGDVFIISIKDYLRQANIFKMKMKGFRTGVEFSTRPVSLDPYFLGVWLGDGNSDRPGITNLDQQILDCIHEQAKQYGLNVTSFGKDNTEARTYYLVGKKGKDNPIKEILKKYNLLFNKHVPDDYKINDRNTRLQILAGLIDTDGDMGNNCLGFCNKNKKLAEDVVFLARSLGLAAYMKPCIKKSQNGTAGTYYRVSISGNCAEIPLRVPHKMCSPRKQEKDHLVTGIKVEPIGEGEYFGFMTDGDHMFLLDDFTVVHNSNMLIKTAKENIFRNKKVLYLTLEMNQKKIARRFDAQVTGVPINRLRQQSNLVIKSIKEEAGEREDKRMLVIKHFPAGTANVDTIRAYLSQMSLRNWRPDLVCLDYVGEMKSNDTIKTYESRQRAVTDLKGYGDEEGFCVFTAMQPHRKDKNKAEDSFIDDDDLADSFGQSRPLDALWSINQRDDEKKLNVARIFIIKHRDGISRMWFPIAQNQDTLDWYEIKEEKYREIMSMYGERKAEETNSRLKKVVINE